MAKQQGSGVVAASRRLSDVQGAFQDRGAQFFKGYNKALEAKKEKEAQNKKLQSRVNSYMQQFTNDIDVLKFKPEDQKLVKNTITGWRQEYVDAANMAAQIQDKSSGEYQEYMDIMNGVKNKMVNLKGNLDNLAAFKGEYGANIDKKHYSMAGANDMALAQGEIMFQYPIGSISDDGDLMWNDEAGGGEWGLQNYKMPFEIAREEAKSIFNLSEEQSTTKGPMTDAVKKNIQLEVEGILSNDNAFHSILSNSDLQLISLEDIDPEDPNARKMAAERITQAIVDTRGTGLEENKNNKGVGGKGPRTTAIMRPEIQGPYKEMQDLEKEIMTTPITPGVTEAPEFTGGAKTWSIGPKDNPSKIRIKLDPQKRKWVYFDASNNVRAEYDSIEELTKAYPSLFFK